MRDSRLPGRPAIYLTRKGTGGTIFLSGLIVRENAHAQSPRSHLNAHNSLSETERSGRAGFTS